MGFLPYYATKLWDLNIPSRIIQRSVFFTGGAFFAASIEWLAPVFHMEIFKFRRTLKKVFGSKVKRKYA